MENERGEYIEKVEEEKLKKKRWNNGELVDADKMYFSLYDLIGSNIAK